MPRTNINVTESSKAGTTMPAVTAADVANGNVIANDGRLLIVASNAGVTPRTVTITPSIAPDGLTVAARTVSLPASASKLLGPYDTATYGASLAVSGDHADVKFQPIRGVGL